MSKLLLSDALSQIDPAFLPESSKQTKWINSVCAKMFAVGKWKGTTMKWRGIDTAVNFAIFNDIWGGRYMTLPRNLLSILAAGGGNTAGSLQARFSTQPIRGPWHEFGNAGWGIGDAVAGSGFQDAGDGFTCFRDLPGVSFLRVKTEVAEAIDAEMLFRGLDENEEEIYTGVGSSSYEGVKLVIGAGLTTTTSQKFSIIPTLIKKPVTYGPVRLYAVDVDSGNETLIGLYDPGDTAPGFRRYRISCQSDSTTVHAMCKRRHIPAVALADEVIPGNVAALESGLQGRRFETSNDHDAAQQYWTDAFAILNSEIAEDNGGATPTWLQSGPSIGRIANIH